MLLRLQSSSSETLKGSAKSRRSRISITLISKNCTRWPRLPHLDHLRKCLSHDMLLRRRWKGRNGTLGGFFYPLRQTNKQSLLFVSRVTLIPDLIVHNPFVLEQGVSSKCQQSSQREGQRCRMIKDWKIGRWMD